MSYIPPFSNYIYEGGRSFKSFSPPLTHLIDTLTKLHNLASGRVNLLLSRCNGNADINYVFPLGMLVRVIFADLETEAVGCLITAVGQPLAA
jgi:hypothetical protein